MNKDYLGVFIDRAFNGLRDRESQRIRKELFSIVSQLDHIDNLKLDHKKRVSEGDDRRVSISARLLDENIADFNNNIKALSKLSL